MKRYGLLLATALVLTMAVCALRGAGWLGSPRKARETDKSSLSAAWEYHHLQARHWRSLMLQH